MSRLMTIVALDVIVLTRQFSSSRKTIRLLMSWSSTVSATKIKPLIATIAVSCTLATITGSKEGLTVAAVAAAVVIVQFPFMEVSDLLLELVVSEFLI